MFAGDFGLVDDSICQELSHALGECDEELDWEIGSLGV